MPPPPRASWKAAARDLWLLGKILDGGADAMHGEFLSDVFFAGEFAEELIQLGQADARPWIDEHPADPWQLDPLPAGNQPPAATETPSAHHTDREYMRSRPLQSSHPPSPGKQRRRLSNVAAPAAGDTRLPKPGCNLREVGLPEALAPGARTARGNAPFFCGLESRPTPGTWRRRLRPASAFPSGGLWL